MWRVQAIPHLVFEFLPGYRGFQILLKGAEVKGALIAQRDRKLSLDVTGGGKRHGKRKGWSDRLDHGSAAFRVAPPTIVWAKRSLSLWAAPRRSNVFHTTT